MDDLISRQAVINAIENTDAKMSMEEWDEITGAVMGVPSAQPQRMNGEWVPEFNGRFTGGAYWFSCSKCKRIVPDVRNGGWNYCPQCGADMRGEQDG